MEKGVVIVSMLVCVRVCQCGVLVIIGSFGLIRFKSGYEDWNDPAMECPYRHCNHHQYLPPA